MAKNIWEDRVSLVSLDTGRIFTATLGSVKLSVARNKNYPGRWVASCLPPVIPMTLLKAVDLAGAKEEALSMLWTACDNVLKDIPPVMEY